MERVHRSIGLASINACGLKCPMPVHLTKTEMKNFKAIEVSFDDYEALHDLKALFDRNGWKYLIEEEHTSGFSGDYPVFWTMLATTEHVC